MFAMVQDREKIFHEIFLDHFKKNKVEIADKITKLFPFLETLRDHSFIPDKLYNDSQEAYRNLVPVSNVVYRVLCHLEETFDESLLQVLFSKVNLKEYPDLIQIHRSFENVFQHKYFSQKSVREETEKMPSIQSRCKKDTWEVISSCHPENIPEDQQTRTAHCQASDIIVINSEDSAESSEENESWEAWRSALGNGPGEKEISGDDSLKVNHREEHQETSSSAPRSGPGAVMK
ncbi:nuclear autoantigen Sp-100-like [Trichechus manatus latirostris]|uniref:Nuclear autoantigen Sp-100-like n=1 Tax=Trichechus manatus latirostris TaxID=127582 RepID=A0A2Y9QLH9_TRIMA|nr:nuclear autoantigen Sp-100-like [Trichechus manatus latirostris]